MSPVLEDMLCHGGVSGPWCRFFPQCSHFPSKFEELLELLVVLPDAADESLLSCFVGGKHDSLLFEIELEVSLTSFAH